MSVDRKIDFAAACLRAEEAPGAGLIRALAVAEGFPWSARRLTRTTRQRSMPGLIATAAGSTVLCLAAWYHWANIDPGIRVPSLPVPAVNGYPLLVKAAASVRGASEFSNAIDEINRSFRSPPLAGLSGRAPGSPSSLRAVEALISANQTSLGLVRRGEQLPSAALGIPLERAGESPDSNFRDLGRLLALEQSVERMRHQYRAAADSGLDAVSLGCSVEHAEALTGMLVGISIEAIGRNKEWTVINHLDATDARKCLERLERIEQSRAPYVDSLVQEKLSGELALRHLFHIPWPGRLLEMLLDVIRGLPYSKRQIYADYDRAMDACIQYSESPYEANWSITTGDPYADAFLPGVAQPYGTYDVNLSEERMLLTEMALRCYYLDHSRYPSRVEELVGRYLQSRPYDPFRNGSQLTYRRTSSGYLLYSVGPDRVDHGGAWPHGRSASEERATYNMTAGRGYDLVAGHYPY
ncbi:MAG TPA: hypothetical protein VGS41_16320 [Chthonomonadales bacterium]|nr:hypothetical protein [Chthonomonadales bacterium]